MPDYLADVQTPETLNWVRCCLAVRIARDGLQPLVSAEVEQLHADVMQTVYSARGLSPDVKCTSCCTAATLPCPTRGLCQVRQGRCNFHNRPTATCPLNLCPLIRQEVERQHRYALPSWRNTDATRWGSSAWELAKCFLPPDGYLNVTSAESTDFNGIISILINCRIFERRFQDDLRKDNNKCIQARKVGSAVRHCADLQMNVGEADDSIDTLLRLLDDPAWLQRDPDAINAYDKLRQLREDRLELTSSEVRSVVEERREELDLQRYRDLKHELRQELAEHYMTSRSSMPLSPLMPEVDDQLTKFYVPIKMYQLQQRGSNPTRGRNTGLNTGELVTSYKAIFYNNDVSHRNVYLQGDAGMGKSVFCIKLALLWASIIVDTCDSDADNVTSQSLTYVEDETFSDEAIVTEFDYIFFICLRDVVEECDVEQMIISLVVGGIPDGKKYEAIVPKVLARERCLVILDGLDEWSHSNSKCKKREALPHRKSWRSTVVLTSTRPWKLHEVRVRNTDSDNLLEIRGVANTRALVDKVLVCLNRNSNKSRLMKQFVADVKLKKVEHFFEIPIVALQLLCLWHEEHELGNSTCAIYSNMLDMLFGRAENRSGLPDNSSSSESEDDDMPTCFLGTEYCREFKPLLDSIARLAYHTLFSTDRHVSLVFTDAVVAQHIPSTDQRQLALMLGILSQQKSPSLVARRSTYSFLHKTFQEFLAAYHIAAQEVPFAVDQYTDDIRDISKLFTFVCGMSPKMASVMSNSVMTAFRDRLESSTDDIDCNHLKIVSQLLQDMVLGGQREGTSNGHNNLELTLTFVVYHPEQYAKEKNELLIDLLRTNKESLVCMYYHADDFWVDINKVHDYLTGSSKTLTYVVFSDVMCLEGGVIDLSASENLKFLALSFFSSVCSVKLNAKSLQHCELSWVHEQVERSILAQLISAPQLQTLGMWRCKNIDLLCDQLLPSLPCLRYLATDCPQLHAALGCLTGLQKLVVERECVQPPTIFKSLTSLVDLQSIIVRHANIGDVVISLPASQREIVLYEVTLTCASFRHLVDSMRQVPGDVTCCLEACAVLPWDDYGDVIEYILSLDDVSIVEPVSRKSSLSRMWTDFKFTKLAS